jgi:hypothetical protein
MGLRPAELRENMAYHERRIPSRDRQGAVVPKTVGNSRSRIFDPVFGLHKTECKKCLEINLFPIPNQSCRLQDSTRPRRIPIPHLTQYI